MNELERAKANQEARGETDWVFLVRSLKLVPKEEEALERFELGSNPASYLPVVDILQSRGNDDEAYELLAWGTSRYPDYVPGRVFLARQMYKRGLIASAWKVLGEGANEALRGNLMAQNLLFRTSMLLGYESVSRGVLAQMRHARILDIESEAIGEILESRGWHAAREELQSRFENLGVALEILEDQLVEANAADQGEKFPGRGLPQGGESAAPSSHPWDRVQVVALGDVFRGRHLADGSLFVSSPSFDTPTLAEIYESQGHFGKALGVYRRLLQLAPSNEFYAAAVRRLVEKEHDQSRADLKLDPRLAAKMDEIERITEKVSFLQGLLHRLN